MSQKLIELSGSQPFSYTCNRCTRCCHHREVGVNPYEVSRLAAARGVNSDECFQLMVDRTSMTLNRREDGACIFLEDNNCTVHADRPLACRLYPLARKRTSSGKEAFAMIPPDPETTGVYGEEGTINSYLQTQDVAEFIAFADRYFDLLRELLAIVESKISPADNIRNMVSPHQSLQTRLLHSTYVGEWLGQIVNFDGLVQQGPVTPNESVSTAALNNTDIYFERVRDLLKAINLS